MNLLSYSWVKRYLDDNEIEPEKLKQSFGYAATYRGVVREHIQRELDKIDKESTLSKLIDKPNRAELLLAYAAKREALTNLIEILID